MNPESFFEPCSVLKTTQLKAEGVVTDARPARHPCDHDDWKSSQWSCATVHTSLWKMKKAVSSFIHCSGAPSQHASAMWTLNKCPVAKLLLLSVQHDVAQVLTQITTNPSLKKNPSPVGHLFPGLIPPHALFIYLFVCPPLPRCLSLPSVLLCVRSPDPRPTGKQLPACLSFATKLLYIMA